MQDGIPASPFCDTSAFPFIAELEANYEKIKVEGRGDEKAGGS